MPNAFPYRLSHHADFPGSIVVPGPVVAGLNGRVQRRGLDDCWFYMPSRTVGRPHVLDPNRYFTLGWRTPEHWYRIKAHRLALIQAIGPIPAELETLHGCGRAACCNPRHLRPGTGKENAKDRQRHEAEGRYAIVAVTARPRIRTIPVCLAA